MTSPLVTVITPVHNGIAHLAECIESVCNQSYPNWEYFVVDNASTDGSPDIVETAARKESRIRLVRYEQFVDVIASFNRAFGSVGEGSTYTKVVGADDVLFRDCLTDMVTLAQANPSVGIVSSYRVDDLKLDLVGLPLHRSVAPGREMLRQCLLGGPYVTGSPTSLLIRSDFVRERQPFYDSDFRHADTEAAYWLLAHSDFALVHRALTFSRRPPVGETPKSAALGTYAPENIRLLLRFGPDVLTPTEYRHALRVRLYSHVWWHLKQRIRPSRRHDEPFRAFHREQLACLRQEGATDREIQRWAGVIGALLGEPPE